MWGGTEEEASEVLHLEHSLYGSETWTLQAVDHRSEKPGKF